MQKLTATVICALLLLLAPVGMEAQVQLAPVLDMAQSVDQDGEAIMSTTTNSCDWRMPGCGYSAHDGVLAGSNCAWVQTNISWGSGIVYDDYYCCHDSIGGCGHVRVKDGGNTIFRHQCPAGTPLRECDRDTDYDNCAEYWLDGEWVKNVCN